MAGDPKQLDQDRDHGRQDRRVAAKPPGTTAAVQPEAATTAVAAAATTADKAAAAVPPANAPREQRIDAAYQQLERGEAIAAQKLFAAIEQPDWRVYSGLGVAASTLGRQSEAQAHFKQALQQSPNNQVVINNLAVSYMLERKPAEAEVVLKRVSATGKASAATLDNLALARVLKAQIAAATGADPTGTNAKSTD